MRTQKLSTLFLAAALAVGAAGPAMAASKAPAAGDADTEVMATAPGVDAALTRDLMSLAKGDAAEDNAQLQDEVANKARALIAKGGDPAYNNGELLMYAAMNGQLGMVKVLVEEGHVDLNVRNGQALLLAAMRGRNEVINYLIDKGMDPDGVEKIGRPLAQAAGNEYISTVELLVKRGAQVNIKEGYPLAIASILGSLKGVEKLIELKADINAGQGLALRSAIEGGSSEVAKYLLDNGADPMLTGVTEGLKEIATNTAKYGDQAHKDVAEMVMKARESKKTSPEQSADPEKAQAENTVAPIIVPPSLTTTELEARQLASNAKLQELKAPESASAPMRPKVGIEKYEGQLQYDDQDGYLLAAAALTNDLEKMKELIAKKSADLNFNEGLPLQSAAGMGYIEAMQLLLDSGADINADGGFSLMAAADGGQKEAVQFLIDHGINIFAGDIELYLEQMQVVKGDEKYPTSKYAQPVYEEIVTMINAARKAKDPDYIPKVYQAIPLGNGMFKSNVAPPSP
jgi:ankyrin repeat protein